MLARYKIYRGKRPPNDPLPNGIRQDARWRTKHPLRPTEEIVKVLLAVPDEQAWAKYRRAYVELLNERFSQDRASFDKLADMARTSDVYIGCNCPTRLNPRVDHCHTVLALEFMKKKYPSLPVRLPRS